MQVCHSTPEAYFRQLRAAGTVLPRHEGDLNPFAIGCYTSQVRLKQKHRELENELYTAEKMLTHAALAGLLPYPQADLQEATHDLLFAEFHDILPGSSVQPVEDMALRLMDHGLEILSRLKGRAFFALASGQPSAEAGRIPVLAYNPHPFAVRSVFECEFMLPDVNWNEEFTSAVVHAGDQSLPSQVEKELGNLNLDWRKRVAFVAELAPGQMSRFDCELVTLPRKPSPALQAHEGLLTHRSDNLEVIINANTGLLDRYRVRGVDYLKAGAFLPIVLGHSDDPWVLSGTRFDDVLGEFALMDPQRGRDFSGVRSGDLPGVRVIEDGPVRTVVEAVLAFGDSFICQRYKLPKYGTEIEIEVRVHWNEKSKLLKLVVPTVWPDPAYLGQVAYGVAPLPADGREAVAQKWVAAVAGDAGALTCINEGSYGSDCRGGAIRLTLLRSPAYTSHPIFERPLLPTDRYSPRIDQGERLFRFWLNAGPSRGRLAAVDREALGHNEKPFVLSFFPSGEGSCPPPLATLDDPVVQIAAFKQAHDSDDYIIRLFEPTGQSRSTVLRIPALGMTHRVALGPFEIKTLRCGKTRPIGEVNLLEQVLDPG